MDDKYGKMLAAQKLLRGLKAVTSSPDRPFGDADERCTVCGGPVETLLDDTGRNPMRCCWKCVSEA